MLTEFRCQKCNKLLGRYRECQELEIKCPRCGSNNFLSRKRSVLLTETRHYMPAAKSQG